MTHSWESRPVLPISRYGHGCAVLEDSLYISGGYTGEVEGRRADQPITAYFQGQKIFCHSQANRHWGTFQWSLTSHFMSKTKIFVGGFLSFQIVTGVQKGQKIGLYSLFLIFETLLWIFEWQVIKYEICGRKIGFFHILCKIFKNA